MADYRQADLDEARRLVPDAGTKAQERVARALATRERKGASAAIVRCASCTQCVDAQDLDANAVCLNCQARPNWPEHVRPEVAGG